MDRFHGTNIRDFDVGKKALVCDLWKNGKWEFPKPLDEDLCIVWDYASNNFVIDASRKDHIYWKPKRQGCLVYPTHVIFLLG